MPYRPFDGQNCSIARSLAILGGRWTLLVMREVLLGRRRFADIRRNVGVAPNILADRLQTLVDHGLLERRLYSLHPESFEYVPTRKGLDVHPVLVALLGWGDRYTAPAAGPPWVLVHDKCGHDAHPEMRCAHCGETVEAGEVRLRPGPTAGARPKGGVLGGGPGGDAADDLQQPPGVGQGVVAP